MNQDIKVNDVFTNNLHNMKAQNDALQFIKTKKYYNLLLNKKDPSNKNPPPF